MTTVGFIGLGIMGLPMASHLLAAGFPLVASTARKTLPSELSAAGATAAANPAETAAAADIIILMVPDTNDVANVLFGQDGVATADLKGKLVIDMSSISPSATRDFARRIREQGAGYLDAPVSGGEVGAKQATLTIMVGGEETDFERARLVFEKMGKNITLVGKSGAGQIAKVTNQIIVALTIEAVAEGLNFARQAGVDPALVRQALTGGLATSRILELHGQRMIERTFEPGFRVALHQKDLRLALESAQQMGIALPNTASTQQLFNLCPADADHSSLSLALETLSRES